MPRVLFLTDSLSNGGAERQLALLVKSLPTAWERRVWSMDNGPFADVIRRSGVQLDIHERSWRWDVTPTFHLWQLVNAWRPDIIHSYGYMSTLAALPIAKLLRIRLIDGTIRQANVPSYRGKIMKWSLQWANLVIANSRAGLQAFGVAPERGRVVYNGFDPERITQCDSLRATAKTPFTVIMVGRMAPEKDYVTFIKAAGMLADKGIECRFIALGDGVLRDSFIRQAKDLIERGIFIVPEPTLEVMPYVAQADVGVLMTSFDTHEEGISNVILEYMASSLPVICSESGGNRELVIDGKTGYVIEPNNPAVLAEKLLWLKQHPAAAQNMGLAGRKQVHCEFSVENLVKKTLSVYYEVLKP